MGRIAYITQIEQDQAAAKLKRALGREPSMGEIMALADELIAERERRWESKSNRRKP